MEKEKNAEADAEGEDKKKSKKTLLGFNMPTMLTQGGHIDCPQEFNSFKCQNPYILTKPAGMNDLNEKGKSDFKSLKAFPCNKCVWCRKRRKAEWTTRLTLECESHDNNAFLTLTYKEYDPFTEPELFAKTRSLDYADYQNFNKMLRQYLTRSKQEKIKFYTAGEYGELSTERAHWHSILFNFTANDQNNAKIREIWKHANPERIDIQEIADSQAVARYVSKYVIKKVGINPTEYEKIYKRKAPFHRGSQGLGLKRALELFSKPALESFREFRDFNHIVYQGKKIILDRYLRNKIAENLAIKDELTYQGLQKLKEYIAETEKIYEIYSVLGHIDETMPEYPYEQSERVFKLRKAWWYRHKQRYYQNYKLMQLSEFKKKVKAVI